MNCQMLMNIAKGFHTLHVADLKNEKGSVIVIAMIILALLTIGGITATNMSVTESFIVRNNAIHKQNLQLAEMAAVEGLRWILNEDDPPDLTPGANAPVWCRSMQTWDNDPTVSEPGNNDNYPLNDNNSGVPRAVTDNVIRLINQRGETADNPLRYYFIGWTFAPGNSLTMTGPRWRRGRVIGVYNSENNGFSAVELGVIKRF